jgi:hypothetical protein
MRGLHRCQGEMHAADRQYVPAMRSFGQGMHIPGSSADEAEAQGCSEVIFPINTHGTYGINN